MKLSDRLGKLTRELARRVRRACSLERMVRRLCARIARRKKARLKNWLPRWDRACKRMWRKLETKPATLENFEWFDRNHGRLMDLSRAKSGKSPNHRICEE